MTRTRFGEQWSCDAPESSGFEMPPDLFRSAERKTCLQVTARTRMAWRMFDSDLPMPEAETFTR
eukprot:3363272-Pleurochrysis_carterae.AAC.2